MIGFAYDNRPQDGKISTIDALSGYTAPLYTTLASMFYMRVLNRLDVENQEFLMNKVLEREMIDDHSSQ